MKIDLSQVLFTLMLPLTWAQDSWTYNSGGLCAGSFPCSPADWGHISATCSEKTFLQQSPINIVSTAVEPEPLFQGHVPRLAGAACNNWAQFVSESSVFQVVFNCSLISDFNDIEYNLVEMDFHSPSEHSLAGGRYPAEIQLKHYSNSSAGPAIYSIFLQTGDGSSVDTPNSYLNIFWEAAGFNAAHSAVAVSNSGHDANPYSSLLPLNTAQFHYRGTTTTPPCETEVDWFVFESPVHVSQSDIAFLRAMVTGAGYPSLSSSGNNNRPTMSRHDRAVYYIPGGALPTASPSARPSKAPTDAPTRAPTAFTRRGPFKLKVKSAMIVACLALTLSGLVVIIVLIWQLYVAYKERKYIKLPIRGGEFETSLPV